MTRVEQKAAVASLSDADLASIRASLNALQILDAKQIQLRDLVFAEQKARRDAKAIKAGSELLKKLL